MSRTTVTLRVTTMMLEDKLPETRDQASRLGLLRRETHQSHDALPGDTLLSKTAKIEVHQTMLIYHHRDQ